MNKKGQALVEFILILPVFLFITLTIIDFGNILYQKYKLENDLDFIATLYENKKNDEINNYVTANKLTIKYNQIENYQNIEITKMINITTPGLNLIMGNPYYISASRFVYE